MPYKTREQRRAYERRYEQRHKERIRLRQKLYRLNHPDRCRKYARKWAKNNPDKVEARRMRHRATDGYRKTQKKYYSKNRLKFSEKFKRFYAGHLEYFRDKARRFRKSHPGYVAEWYRKHPDVARALWIRRRLRIKAQSEGGCRKAIKSMCSKSVKKCYYCGRKIKTFHIDHVMPVARGGKHSPSNLCVACPECNQAKWAKLLSQWVPNTQQQMLQI